MKFKKLIFDFDRTLFNDDAFINSMIDAFKQHGATEQDLLVGYEEMKQRGLVWTPWLWAEISGLERGLVDGDIEKFLQTAYQHVYDDARAYLADGRDRVPKMILSFGDKKTQLAKIRNSGISHHFNDIVITADDLKNDFFRSHAEMQKGTCFIDDRADIIDSVKSQFPGVFCVHIRRTGSRYASKRASLADREITTLFDFGKILE